MSDNDSQFQEKIQISSHDAIRLRSIAVSPVTQYIDTFM